jgi:hypothetical protein
MSRSWLLHFVNVTSINNLPRPWACRNSRFDRTQLFGKCYRYELTERGGGESVSVDLLIISLIFNFESLILVAVSLYCEIRSYKHKADSIKNNNHTQHSFTSMRHRFFKRKPNQGKNLVFLRCSASSNFVTSHLL